MSGLDSMIESVKRTEQFRRRFLLLALAPWPTLLSLIRKHPDDWTIWGSLPPLVAEEFELLGAEIRSDPLPKPFHRTELPDWVRRPWRAIVVPALGNPLPSRLPALRHLAQLGSPLFVASHDRIEKAPSPLVGADPFSWAFDRLDQPPERTSIPIPRGGPIACVRGDLLGDILLTLPALIALGAANTVRVITRNNWLEWLKLLMPEGTEFHGISFSPWVTPVFAPAAISVDLSPPGWPSPLTPGLARSVPAHDHRCISRRLNQDGLSAMVAAEFGLTVSWPVRSQRESRIGMAITGGSSGERAFPAGRWAHMLDCASRILAIRQWLLLDTGDGLAAAVASAMRDATVLDYPQPPADILSLCKSAALVLGVSTGITHLAALTGTPSVVVEHPTTVPGLYRALVPFVHYVRPECPWWVDDPACTHWDRALANPEDSYGFETGELERQLEEALLRLA